MDSGMTKPKTTDGPSFRPWIYAWSKYIQALEVVEGSDLDEVDHQDLVAKANLPRLTALLKDERFFKLLEKTYCQLHAKVGESTAQRAVRQFVMNACWICQPRLNLIGCIKDNATPDPGGLKRDWERLAVASIKLAKQIEDLSPRFGPDSYEYLEERIQAGNPVGFVLERKNAWRNALPQHPTRRLSELLRCFASDILEEAALLNLAIADNRQKGGKQAGLHFAMDALTTASIVLSVVDPPKPNFVIVNSVIATLLDPSDGFDPSTVRLRYMTAQRRKTRA
jgi:hypothetical protein